MYYIYKLTNKLNGRCYIGVTNNYDKRMREHSYANNDYAISRAIKKHGWESFEHEILEKTEDSGKAYRQLEADYIVKFNSKQDGYNLTDGGEGCVGWSPSKDTRRRMSEAKKGSKLTEDHKNKISNSLKGREFSKDSRKKISNKLMGNENFKGKSHSKETKAKLSEQKSQEWKVINPNGDVVYIKNMRKFCLDNNLHNSAMSRVMSGKQKSHKGYTKM